MIRKATLNDLNDIMSILQSVGKGTKNATSGFLMGDYTRNEEENKKKLANDLENNKYTYVLSEEEKVVSFLIAYGKDYWFTEVPEWEEEVYWHPQFDKKCLNKFIVINQTAMYPDLVGKGLGSRLYEELFKDLRTDGIVDIFAETIVAPVPNIASLQFRIKQKYDLAGMRYESFEGTDFTTLVYHKAI